MAGFFDQMGTYLTGGYDPTNMLMKKAGMEDNIPGWVNGLNTVRSMGPIGFSNGRSWFGMQQGNSNGGQAALMAALMGDKLGAKPQTPVTIKNESTQTPLAPSVRTVQPMRYNAIGPWEQQMQSFHPMSNLGSSL